MTLPNDETPQGGWYADEIWLSGDSLDGKHTGGMGCWSYNECDVDPDCDHIRYVRADLHDAEVIALRKRVEAADAVVAAITDFKKRWLEARERMSHVEAVNAALAAYRATATSDDKAGA